MQPTNVLEPVTVTEIDPMDAASNPSLPVFELWGKLEVSAWYCALVKVQGKVPFDANIHDKRFTAIDLFIQPLPEQNITNAKSCEDHMIAEDNDWIKITWASIKALGIDSLRTVNGKWARVEKVNGKPYYEKGPDGKPAKFNAQGQKNEPKGYEKKFKVIALFDTEDACRTAYFASGNTDKGSVNSPVMVTDAPADNSETERNTALAFLAVIVPNAVKSKTTSEEKKVAVSLALTQYPTVNKFFTADSAEVVALMGA